ncbi:Arm DNA-binding domain-containing protein [Mucilaginibacter antarcticus]|uniref:Arm DNA-binding domain-containing protein n=1 Tax=Mucilaginibacter antarcticus TaxID=1855725 RepID=A0ABW5XT87_9SPHI
MKVNEDLSILFWLKRQKATKEGLVPIYVRITVKGGRTEFSSGKKSIPIIGMKNPQLPQVVAQIIN